MARSEQFNVGSSPVRGVVDASQRYSQAAGINIPETNYGGIIMPESVSQRVGKAYESLPDFDSGALPSFRAFGEETKRQFDFMTKPRRKGGMGLDVEVQDTDPYGGGNPLKAISEFRDDVLTNNRMKVMSTKSTGGHPYFSNDENDMFRAVHDTFGHLGSGRGVDFDGEEAAFQKHARMYTPLARGALATETRGQNAALRANGEFQDQKVALLPERMQSLSFNEPANMQERLKAVVRSRQKNAEQGIG